ncbi:MAG: nitrogenase component 1 [Oscillospiraceae bacterium]
MKQTARTISTYAADVSGVCSALFELGGMTVMHDASGCNSTYNTHDEPRWYDTDSMVYISGLSEMEAIMGDDEKLISDIVSAAEELRPNFIAIAGSPIPMMVGTDFPAVAAIIEKRTGIPAFGFATNGMHSYLSGAGMAFREFSRRITQKGLSKVKNGVNILGATPLDFSTNGSVQDIRCWLLENGFSVVSSWAMGSSLDELTQAGRAEVNLVVSSSGLAAARDLERKFGIPFVVGVPIGGFQNTLARDLHFAQAEKTNIASCAQRTPGIGTRIAIIGESVFSESLASALPGDIRVLCPLEAEPWLLTANDRIAEDEDDLIPLLQDAHMIIADPLYKPICPPHCKFITLPHEGFSGRIFRRDIPNLIANFDYFSGVNL